MIIPELEVVHDSLHELLGALPCSLPGSGELGAAGYPSGVAATSSSTASPAACIPAASDSLSGDS